ncbi:MAG: Hpt domain-containing protein [Jannaschia helgolandensis]|jgi:HPt (histidine-containing phosphotransfer) domain-containing protein|uniref:Hpt domain-containing protein n=1 Tax=Jannaschia helgolandensis TaxID=188906 RepID=A0A1H7G9B6_9RHOB|nr:Hpt domain-containing protein [Jannaschia helgolandensis]SEK32375.1 Hpt domain-containing protein [Jannaschia helgolandensis]
MIDTERIAELQAEIGAEDLSCIVSVYLEEARATLAQIAAGLTEEDHARAIHFLRSGALNIGLSGVADVAGKMTCRAASSRDDCADRFRDVLDHTMAEVTDSLA